MVTISEDLGNIVRLGVLRFDGVRVVATDRGHAVDSARVRAATNAMPGDRVSRVWSMYRCLGIDPTKTRPSSEALLRRVRRGEPLPRINTLVDVCKLCALETQLPYGLYDLQRIEGPVILRVGQPGEEYPGIRKRMVHVAGRPALFDERGPVGNPTSDSARTMVTEVTASVLAVVFAPRSISVQVVQAVLDLTGSRVLSAAGGLQRGRWVVGD